MAFRELLTRHRHRILVPPLWLESALPMLSNVLVARNLRPTIPRPRTRAILRKISCSFQLRLLFRAARRVNDYTTTVRIFEGIKEKVENKSQYDACVRESKLPQEELGKFIHFLLIAVPSYYTFKPTIVGGTLPIMKTLYRSAVTLVLISYTRFSY